MRFLKKHSKVYIILLNYNGWADTIECLESILRNDYPHYQIIVVDNNSQDNSIEYIKAWTEGKLDIWVNPSHPLRKLSFPSAPKPIPHVYYDREEAEKGGNQKFETILEKDIPEEITTKYPLVFIQTGKNLGFAGGNNVGIRYALARNDFDNILLLNNDTVIEKNAISELIKAKKQYCDNAIYGGRIYYYSDIDKIWYDGGRFNEWLGRSTHINIGKKNIPLKPIHKVNFITFCLVLIPNKIIKEIGLLDESYFMYVEDLDYSYKVCKKGYKLYHVSSSKIWHKVGASSKGELSEFSAYWMMRNRVKFILQNLELIKKLSAFTFLIFSRIIRYPIWLNKKKLVLAQIKGLIEGFKNV